MSPPDRLRVIWNDPDPSAYMEPSWATSPKDKSLKNAWLPTYPSFLYS